MSSPITLQWRTAASDWQKLEFSHIPLERNVKIHIDFTAAGEVPEAALIGKIKEIFGRIDGDAVANTTTGPLIEPEPGDNLLEVIVSDGKTAFALDPRIEKALKEEASHWLSGSRTWVLPLMPRGGEIAVMPEKLQKINVAFWEDSVAELALTILARSGVTSLDRRVFISYRRVETTAIADQLFEELSRRNFSVFLDTVSVEPGVDFQARLFEQLADKSMVVSLHSKTFSQSRWTMAEITYVKEHDLSLLILRWPEVPEKDPLDAYYRSGDFLCLAAADMDSPTATPSRRLTPEALKKIVSLIVEQHDLEMINRFAVLRRRTLEALKINGVTCEESERSASILAISADGVKTYRLFPASRPPGLSELFGASTFTLDTGDRRIVIGHVSSYDPERIRQMDWTVDGRNVAYADVSMLDSLAREIKNGTL